MNNPNTKQGCVMVLLLVVAVCSFFFGFVALFSGLSGNVVEGASPLPLIFVGSLSIAAGVYCMITYLFIFKRMKRFNEYHVLVGKQKSVQIQWLA